MIAKSIADTMQREWRKKKGLKYLLNALKPVDSEFRANCTTSEYKQNINRRKTTGTGNHSFL